MDEFEVYTALATPLYKGKPDYASLEHLLQRQLDARTDGVVVLGTTAETPLLTDYAKNKILKKVVGAVQGKKKIVVGVGAPSTRQTLKNAKRAEEAGAEYLLVVTPYYTKFTEEGILRHFESLSKATPLPLVPYNVPHRTGSDLSLALIRKLCSVCNVYAVKEASADVKKVRNLAKSGIKVLGGNDALLPLYKKTGGGLISVLTNVFPDLATSVNADDEKLFVKLAQLCQCEVSPVAAKYLLYKKGVIRSPEMLLPLTALDEKGREKADAVLAKYEAFA